MTTNRRVLGDTPQDVERARAQQVADKLPTITFLLMGSFSRIDRHDLAVALLPMLIGFAILVSQSWKLNVLSFGEEEAAPWASTPGGCASWSSSPRRCS